MPSLTSKRVTPHVLRHTNAMLLRAEKVDQPEGWGVGQAMEPVFVGVSAAEYS